MAKVELRRDGQNAQLRGHWAYKARHNVENLFCRIKDFGRIVLRKCKTSRSYAGFVSLAFALVNIQFCP
jgi:transposase